VPYVVCPNCSLRLYTAAVNLRREECPRCSTTLEPQRRSALLAKEIDAVSREMGNDRLRRERS
jgi:uncharacterized paraquat-inducible protein A